jgi:2-dehydro-3-deoxyglucarate aldolase/4-hydroxy-2-oxoheptanedioate aldolase
VPHAGVAALNDDIVGIVQVESPGMVEAADEVAAIDGVDVLFVGPADLSHSLGVAGRFAEPVYRDSLRRVVDACRRHGKAAGILLYDHASFRPHLELGFTFVGLGADVSFVAEGARAALASARAT